MADGLEVTLQGVEQIAFRAALKDFTEKDPARFKYVRREGGSSLREPHDADVIGLGVSDRRRGHVRQYDIGRAAAKARLQEVFGGRGGEIHLDDVDAGIGSKLR